MYFSQVNIYEASVFHFISVRKQVTAKIIFSIN